MKTYYILVQETYFKQVDYVVEAEDIIAYFGNMEDAEKYLFYITAFGV